MRFCHNTGQGRTGIVKHEIDTGKARPIKQAPRTIPLAKRNELKELVDEMTRSGAIEPSSGPWSSPVVKKKDGSTIFCVAKKDSYPLPRIDDTLDTLAGTKWFPYWIYKAGIGRWRLQIRTRRKQYSVRMADYGS